MKLNKKLNNVQDFIPVKDIRYGIIETTDGRYIKLLEIEPINFMNNIQSFHPLQVG